jgi:hypothetical protein
MLTTSYAGPIRSKRLQQSPWSWVREAWNPCGQASLTSTDNGAGKPETGALDSCRYWIHHLEQSQALSSKIEDVLLFLQKHFPHWVEAMSLLGLISEVVGMLDLLHTVIPVSNIVDSHS